MGPRSARAFSLIRNVSSLWERPADTHGAIDGLRAIAVSWVIAFHVFVFIGRPLRHGPAEPIFRLANRGLLGVDIFFVLSGFLIGRLLFRELTSTGTIAFRRFYARRALRILPAYYVSLLIYCVLVTTNRDTVWANLLFVNNFLPESRQCMPWTWSLAIEEQFYIVFPLLLVVLFRATRRRLASLLALFALATAVRAVIVDRYAIHLPSADHSRVMYDALYDKPHARFGELLAGAIAAYALDFTPAAEALRRAPRLSITGMCAALTIIAASATTAQPIFHYGWPREWNFAYYTFSTSLFSGSVAYALFVCLAGARGGRHLDRLLSLRIFRPIAQLSYSAYLLHVMVITIGLDVAAFEPAVTVATMASYLVALPIVSLLSAAPLYLLVEKPLMNLRTRR
ncbi:MAG: acyltransferase [Labilithrix sp.]|nr:acyltransferase [Labilithrix sp.]MCW5814003.1 acyltransferase [Labilithrix sp.]